MNTPKAPADFTEEEWKALNVDIMAVLEKHNAEIGVISTISITKRQPDPIPEEEKAEGEAIPSPFVNQNGTDTGTEEGKETKAD